MFKKLVASVRKNKTLSVLVAAVLLLCVLTLVAYNWQQTQKVNTTMISGNNLLTKSEINAIVDKVVAHSNGEVNLFELKKELLKNEYVADAKVWVKAKGIIGIEITENVPIALLVDNSGNIRFVGLSGDVFNVRFSNNYNNLPIITGIYLDGTDKIITHALQGAIRIANELQNSFPQLDMLVSEIRFDVKKQNYSLYMNDDKYRIELGRANDRNNDVYNKLTNIEIFFTAEQFYTAAPDIKIIDAQWQNMIVTK